MTEERLPPVAEDSEVDEGSMGGEEWETEISEFETSSVYSSTFTHSSEYDGGSAKLNGVLLNLVLAICVVVALIAHVQLGKSELTTPPKAGGITPELLDGLKHEGSRLVRGVSAVPAFVPQFIAGQGEDFSESEEESETLSDVEDDGPASLGRKDDLDVASSEGIKTTGHEVNVPTQVPQHEPVGSREAVLPRASPADGEPSTPQETPIVGESGEEVLRRESGDKEAAEDASSTPQETLKLEEADHDVVRKETESTEAPEDVASPSQENEVLGKEPESRAVPEGMASPPVGMGDLEEALRRLEEALEQGAAEKETSVGAGLSPVGLDKFPQQEVPVPPVAEGKLQEVPKPDMVWQKPERKASIGQKQALQVPTLISCLKEPRFEPPFKLDDTDLEPFRDILSGHPEDAVQVQGRYVLRQQLQDFLKGQWVDVTMLQLYTDLVDAHIQQRVALGLQGHVALLSASDLSIAWSRYMKEKRFPEVDQESIRRSLTADRVLFAMTAPLLDWEEGHPHGTSGHFIVAVINRKEHRVSVVDSLPHPPSFYEPILNFIKLVAQQLHDPAAGPVPLYEASPHVPEPGFPMQLEALPGLSLLPGIREGLSNACGPFCMENILCIAEGRQPNYTMADARNIRLRVLLELLNGIWVRPLINGHFREGFRGLDR